ncbi:hypothetical protein [Desulfospira joergensenii]|uniref:hypothetical protein n=1 Tax=Desulfospira joergensenii TaxID=53329 RepID=UPI0003B38678|nr:hypothetical protein [Desulfospira joergensenii]
MTTIPGHNQVLQNSGVAQEASQQAHSPKPSPEQAAGVQQTQEVIQNSTVQGSEEAEKLKKEKKEQRRKARQKKKNAAREEDLALDPDAPGRLLDTII